MTQHAKHFPKRDDGRKNSFSFQVAETKKKGRKRFPLSDFHFSRLDGAKERKLREDF
jgi:hypothetical protein